MDGIYNEDFLKSRRLEIALRTFEETPERLYRIYCAVQKTIPPDHPRRSSILDMMENAFLDIEAAADAMIEAFGKRGERPGSKSFDSNWGAAMSTEIGRRIAAAREATGFTVEALAEYLGVKAKDVSDMEAGSRPVDLDTLIRLSDLFGRSPEFFLSGRDDPDHRITLLHPRGLSPRDRVRLAPVFRLLREYTFIRSLTPDGGGERPDSKKPRL